MQSSIIFGDLPTGVMCGEVEYQLYTDFRVWMRLESMLFDEEGTFFEKLPNLLKLCYPVLPKTLEDAVFGMICFYLGKKPETENKRSLKAARQLYSFRQDASLIYAGFYQQYGIDLSKADLHWFQFKALFESLGEETKFSKVLGYRSVDLSMFENPEKRRIYRRLKELYRLPDRRDEAEREAALLSVMESLF